MGMVVVSVCLPTYRPIFSMVIPKFRTKMASFGSGWDSDRGLQRPLPEMQETPNPTDLTFQHNDAGLDTEADADADLGTGLTRPKPSQSRAFSHIGILGGDLGFGSGAGRQGRKRYDDRG